MKAARQVALLSKVDELVRELKSVRIDRVGTSTSAESYGMPRSALGHVVSYLRQQRPNREELLAFLHVSPSIDALEAQNDDNPAAHQKALADVLLPFLSENPDLPMEEILFVWGWVQGFLPGQKKGKQEATKKPAPEKPARALEFGPRKVAGQKSEPQNATVQDLAARFNKKL